MKFLKTLQKGISLLEVMLSLSIIAIILVMATRYFFTANNSQRINESMTQIQGVIGAYNAYRNVHNTYNATFSDLVEGKFFPQQGVTGCDESTTPWTGCTLQNPWGNAVAFGAAAATGVVFTFTVDDQATCNRMIPNIPGATCTGTDNNVLRVQVGSGGADPT